MMANIELTDEGVLVVTLYGELDNHEANGIRGKFHLRFTPERYRRLFGIWKNWALWIAQGLG